MKLHFRTRVYALALLGVVVLNIDGFGHYERASRIEVRIKVYFLPAFDVEYLEKFRARFPCVATRCVIKKPIDCMEVIKAELRSATEVSTGPDPTLD